MQDRACDAAEYPLPQVRMAIGAHDEEVGAESCGLRQQEAPHVFAAGRQLTDLHSRAVTREVTRDVRPYLNGARGRPDSTGARGVAPWDLELGANGLLGATSSGSRRGTGGPASGARTRLSTPLAKTSR